MAGEFNSVIYSLIAAVIVIPLTALINIKIKFAANEEEATRHLKKIILKIVLILINVFIVFMLYKVVNSSEPVTRVTILNIAVLTSILLFSIITHLIRLLLDVILDLTTAHMRHLGATHKIIDIISRENDEHIRNVDTGLKSTNN
jgi:uncharacterized BrkB/YihY/UPF0761 family membrane protein